MTDVKKFLEAVVLGGIALIVGGFLGLFIEPVLENYVPEVYNNSTSNTNENNYTDEWLEYDGSILQLMVDNFLPMWFLSLIIGVVVLILAVTDAL